MRKPHMHRAWMILGSSSITLFIAYAIRIGAFSVLLPEMIQEFQLTKAEGGMIKTSMMFTYTLFSPLVGWLTDRIGGRFVICFFCLFLGAGTFLMGKTSGLLTAVLFFGIVGIGAAGLWTPVVTLVQRWFGESRRGLALGILSPSYVLGFGLMGLILPIIVKQYGWRIGWFILGICGFGLVPLNAAFLRSRPEEMGIVPWAESLKESKAAASADQPLGYSKIFTKQVFWLIGFAYLLIASGTYIILDFIVTYGVMELKIHYTVASGLISVVGFSSVFGGFILLTLSDYIGRKKSLVIIQTWLGCGILLTIFVGNRITLMMVGMGIFGFLYGAIWPMYGATARDYFPKEMTGTIIGLWTIFYGVGAMICPVVAGYLADVTGTFRWPFGLAALTCFIAALLVGFLRKPTKFDRQP